MVLEPSKCTRLRGDYKTGKRLNIKKIIPFIASNYRNDKIWLRRTLPAKRDYRVILALDDSLSMRHNQVGFFALEGLVTLLEGLSRLEVGEVGVVGLRDRSRLLKDFSDAYSRERGAFVVSQFDFAHSSRESSELAMARLVKECEELLRHGGGERGKQIVIVLSDGRFNKKNVAPVLSKAEEAGVLFVFVVLDI